MTDARTEEEREAEELKQAIPPVEKQQEQLQVLMSLAHEPKDDEAERLRVALLDFRGDELTDDERGGEKYWVRFYDVGNPTKMEFAASQQRTENIVVDENGEEITYERRRDIDEDKLRTKQILVETPTKAIRVLTNSCIRACRLPQIVKDDAGNRSIEAFEWDAQAGDGKKALREFFEWFKGVAVIIMMANRAYRITDAVVESAKNSPGSTDDD